MVEPCTVRDRCTVWRYVVVRIKGEPNDFEFDSQSPSQFSIYMSLQSCMLWGVQQPAHLEECLYVEVAATETVSEFKDRVSHTTSRVPCNAAFAPYWWVFKDFWGVFGDNILISVGRGTQPFLTFPSQGVWFRPRIDLHLINREPWWHTTHTI